jgi:tRNA dimethylallyltransferase
LAYAGERDDPAGIGRVVIMKDMVVFLTGPTAVGKTEAAVRLALKLNAEIISCDSMQLYKGMDIITSKPDARQRKKVAHHMLDIVSPGKEYNAAVYRKKALGLIKSIRAKGKIPLFVGGTGLYISILVDGIFTEGPRDQKVRGRLYQEAVALGGHVLYERLQVADPLAADRIHPHDTKRIIRALEVFESTGKPISQLQKQRKGLADECAVRIICLTMQRQELYDRIDQRVEQMFKAGLVEEARKLLGLQLSKTASCAIGIRELKGYFEGEYSLEQAKQLMQKNTRNYAKRQLTWFRKDKRIEWVWVAEDESAQTIAARLYKLCTAHERGRL